MLSRVFLFSQLLPINVFIVQSCEFFREFVKRRILKGKKFQISLFKRCRCCERMAHFYCFAHIF